MNENNEQEQEQPMTKWPFYAHLVLALSILFAVAVLLVGFLQLWGELDTTILSDTSSKLRSHWQVAAIVALCLGLTFFAGAFVFLALKTMTERGEAAGKAVVWVCRILFYPFHVVVRAVVRLAAVVLLFVTIVGGACLACILYTLLDTHLENAGDVTTVFLGVGFTSTLVYALPNYVLPIVKKSMGNIEKITDGASDLYMFPGMVMSESLRSTMDAVRKIDREVVGLFINLLLLILLSMVAVAGFSALDAITDEETVEEKSSYIFLRNMPWIVGNVQSFFSSAVVFPRDATPEDLTGDGEGALSLNEFDTQFYRAVYEPVLDDLARCGAHGKQVRIELSGFASTSDISSVAQQDEKIREKCSDLNNRLKRLTNSGEQPDINELFNLCVTERRSNFVKGMLEGFVEEESQGVFKFQVKQWDSLKQMREQTNKIFCDTPGRSSKTPVKSGPEDKKSCPDNAQYDSTKGLMNRRVDVAIIETPLCMM